MYTTIATVLDKYTLAWTIVLVFVRPGTFATFHDNGIVIDMHEAAVDDDIGAGIDIDSVRRGSATLRILWPYILRRSIDVTAQIAHMVALVNVVGPERRIDKVHILNGHVLTVGDIGQSGALRILIGALGVPRATNPELLPEV